MPQIDITTFRAIFGEGSSNPIFDEKDLGVVTNGDMEVLATLCSFFRPSRVVEIGVYEGKTARSLLGVSPWITEYVGIDVDPAKLSPEFCESFASYPDLFTGGMLNPQAVRGRYAAGDLRFKLVLLDDVLGLKPEMFRPRDMVFIDGDHSYDAVKRDTEVALQGIGGRGLIVWHDYNWRGTRRFIDERNSHGNRVCHVAKTEICFERLGIIL